MHKNWKGNQRIRNRDNRTFFLYKLCYEQTYLQQTIEYHKIRYEF